MADLGNDNMNSVGSTEKLKHNFLAQSKFLKAPVLSNPSAKVTSEDGPSKLITNNPFASITTETSLKEETKTDVTKTDTNNKSSKENEPVPKFVPLHTSKETISFASTSVTTATPTGLSRATGFVFGQNLKERIVGGSDNAGEGTSKSSEHSATNGSSDFLFSAAVQATADSQSSLKDEGNSLIQSAQQTWERVRETAPVIPPPQRVLTGEEGEINQLQMNCRLFAFEGGLWKERGRAQLRLNDSMNGSRLVCRSAGSFRVLLNTKIWSSMTVEKAGAKSLRVTATDSQQQLKVFLIMASPDEISQLYTSLIHRVEQAKHTSDADENISENLDHNEINNINSSDISDSGSKSNEKDDDEDDSEKNISVESNTSQIDQKSSHTPVVVISAEVDDDSSSRETLKRSRPEEENSIPKKMCMEFPTEDDAQL